MNPYIYRELPIFKGKAFAGVDKVKTIVDSEGNKGVVPKKHKKLQVKNFSKKDVKIMKGFDIKCKFNSYRTYTLHKVSIYKTMIILMLQVT